MRFEAGGVGEHLADARAGPRAVTAPDAQGRLGLGELEQDVRDWPAAGELG